ncbi:MAG: enoyl-CoA hydratase/isomerase family protein, partial [Gammaproteobacteria bacterium]|nr:enoyl-CoA hydratase/isomerase family protein [Gemmatimonadota bacterium]NIR35384.1 enoyl-CoA hydratase/isomerase family protein [Actinomycetota bacterium]NIU73055.1 enoyl-CoA hydratase/isomerase family protein [Gammaproteobacteria bacterium]NIX19242.1 enoyl-CoA hydratase/isomerase family protein [Actinomycetota bacterium]
EAILEIAFGPVPMVAAVHGVLTGGSLGLVLACDRVVLAAETTIRSWYATVGFAPDGGWTALLPGVIGRRRA